MIGTDKQKDQYQAFLTTDQSISRYMVSLLRLTPRDILLEPSAGEGHLIDAVRSLFPSLPITAYELHSERAKKLKNKYQTDQNIHILERDTIVCPDLDSIVNSGPKFTKILANPPYGGWQEYERRNDLKKRFPGFYVKETYTLFLLRCLPLLHTEGRLVFIIPDTFLYLHLHLPIRKLILENFTLESIDILKSSLFPGIAFGYANLCIITIVAIPPTPSHLFRLRLVEVLTELECRSHCQTNSRFLLQENLTKNDNYTISLASPQLTKDSESNIYLMSDLAKCVTGFYSGNDKIFLRIASPTVKRSQGYQIVNQDLVENHPFSQSELLNGIEGKRSFIPILKGGGYHFRKPPMWYVDWSTAAVAHYKSDQKARFQNRSYYFQRGIGLPMVTSTKATAAIIDDALFDQSIVGIFPDYRQISLEFLLAYCNSLPFWLCLKAINPSANNSAKYVLKTPIILPDADKLELISEKTKELLDLLTENDQSALLLQDEILSSIAQYVKIKVSQGALNSFFFNTLDQL